MSISSSIRKAGPYTCNGVTVAFPFTFKVFADADVVVVLTDAASVETIQTLTTHYTVALNADQDANPGGTITMLTAPATGELLTLTSAISIVQSITLTNQGGFYPKVINDALDRLTIVAQQIQEQVDRSVKAPISGSIDPEALIAQLTSDAASAASSAAGALASKSSASASESAAAASAASAATSEASAVGITNVFSTVALGLAGVASGQYFGVVQTYGDAVDIYLNNAGAEVYQFTRPYGNGVTYEALSAISKSSMNVASFAVPPVIDLSPIDSYKLNGQAIRNLRGINPVSDEAAANNILWGTTGADIQLIAATNAVVTKEYDNGPTGAVLSAARVQLTPGAVNAYAPIMSGLPGAFPSGAYAIAAQFKGTTGAGNGQQFEFGEFNATATVVTVDEGVWIKATDLFNLPGTGYLLINVDAGGLAVDICVDELQWYYGSSTPTYAVGAVDDCVPRVISPFSAKYRSGLIQTIGSETAPMVCPLPNYPVNTTMDEGTIVAILKCDGDTAFAGRVIDVDASWGTFNIGVDSGRLFSVYGGSGTGMDIIGWGYIGVVVRFSATENSMMVNDIITGLGTGKASFVKNKVGIMGDANGSFGIKNTSISQLCVFDRSLTDQQAIDTLTLLNDRHSIAGRTPIAIGSNDMCITEGDSISTFTPSYADIACSNTVTPIWDKSVSGTTLTGVNGATDHFPTISPYIQAMIARGNNVILSVFHGANGIPTQQEITDYCASAKATGAKVIVCTVLPKGSDSVWETNRLSYNSMLAGLTGVYDALCDLGGDATIGAFGAPTARVYYSDDVHLNAAGHVVAATVFEPVLQSLKTH